MKKFSIIYLSIAVATLSSCNTSISYKSTTTFFDIPTFINTEAARLQKENPLVTKTVSNEKSTETKQLKISNWQKELAQFANIDINKSGSIELVKERRADTLFFNTTPDAKNRLNITIVLNEEQPVKIRIFKETKNLLFRNMETFDYAVGKYYTIAKIQQVKGMGLNRYSIKGEIQ